jgi:hypothetical protein
VDVEDGPVAGRGVLSAEALQEDESSRSGADDAQGTREGDGGGGT